MEHAFHQSRDPRFSSLHPTGTWVEDASQKRCCAISTCALVLFFEHSPRLKAMTSWNQGNHGQSFAVTFRDEHGINCSAFRQTVVIQAVVCDERPLFCSNIQVCSQVFQRSTYAFTSPTLQVCVSPVKIRESNGVYRVQDVSFCSRRVTGALHSVSFFNHCITSSDEHETCCFLNFALTRILLHSVAATFTVAGNLALSTFRSHNGKCAVVKGMQRNAEFGTHVA